MYPSQSTHRRSQTPPFRLPSFQLTALLTSKEISVFPELNQPCCLDQLMLLGTRGTAPSRPGTFVDPDGTCRIYYGAPDPPELSFTDSFYLHRKMKDIRNVELYYHLQPDDLCHRLMYPFLPSMSGFRGACPIWHFVDVATEGPIPEYNGIITYHGKGEFPYDY